MYDAHLKEAAGDDAEDTDLDVGELTLRLLDAPDVEAAAREVLEYSLSAVGCERAAVVLVGPRRRVRTVAVTDDVVADVGELRDRLGEGPVLDTLADRCTVVSKDLAADSRWPTWGRMAVQRGMRSVLSVPLRTHRDDVGALALYDSVPGRFEDEDVALTELFAPQASAVLAAHREEDGLRRAVESRHFVGMAQGVLMERFDMDAAQAFEVLRRHSRDNNVKLRDVAAFVVARRELPPSRVARRRLTA